MGTEGNKSKEGAGRQTRTEANKYVLRELMSEGGREGQLMMRGGKQ